MLRADTACGRPTRRLVGTILVGVRAHGSLHVVAGQSRLAQTAPVAKLCKQSSSVLDRTSRGMLDQPEVRLGRRWQRLSDREERGMEIALFAGRRRCGEAAPA